jgi:hypothetical protein
LAQRQLILIAKVLQNLANDTLPGNKESYMMQLNEFITNNKDSLEAFYDTIVNNVDRGRSSALEVPDEVRLNSLASLHAHIRSQREADRQAAARSRREPGRSVALRSRISRRSSACGRVSVKEQAKQHPTLVITVCVVLKERIILFNSRFQCYYSHS